MAIMSNRVFRSPKKVWRETRAVTAAADRSDRGRSGRGRRRNGGQHRKRHPDLRTQHAEAHAALAAMDAEVTGE